MPLFAGMHERKEVLLSPVLALPMVPRRSSAGAGVPAGTVSSDEGFLLPPGEDFSGAGLVERLLRVEVVELTELLSPEERVEVLEVVAGACLPRLEEAKRLEVREDLGFFAFER